jgi:hypothetical protein
LKPTVPALAHEITAPVGSVMVTIVLLNVLLMWASPELTFFFSLRRTFLAPAGVRPLGGICNNSYDERVSELAGEVEPERITQTRTTS